MRALSARQITRCETGREPRCRCRCRGLLHGIKRQGFTQLPMFHIPPENQHVGRKASNPPGPGPEAAPGVASPPEEAAGPDGARGEAA